MGLFPGYGSKLKRGDHISSMQCFPTSEKFYAIIYPVYDINQLLYFTKRADRWIHKMGFQWWEQDV